MINNRIRRLADRLVGLVSGERSASNSTRCYHIAYVNVTLAPIDRQSGLSIEGHNSFQRDWQPKLATETIRARAGNLLSTRDWMGRPYHGLGVLFSDPTRWLLECAPSREVPR